MRALVAGADEYLLKLNFEMRGDVEAMLARTATPAAEVALDSGHHGRFLRSAGLTDEQIDALRVWAELGFPDNKALAGRLGISENAASKLVRRAEEKLGVEERAQLAGKLTVLSGFGLREAEKRRDALRRSLAAGGGW
jgi:DNA-binding CsgD family transcriptional regulator